MTRKERFEIEKITFDYKRKELEEEYYCGNFKNFWATKREIRVAIEYFNNKRKLREISLMLGVSWVRVGQIKDSLIRKCIYWLSRDNIVENRCSYDVIEEIYQNKEKVLKKIKEIEK